MKSSAVLSPCRTWRYSLSRIWDPTASVLNVIGLNPSTADETTDDPTIRRCIGFARSWGFGGLMMTNLFAYRSTAPKLLSITEDPIGPDNDAALLTAASHAALVLAAWGDPGKLAWRAADVAGLVAGKQLHCLRHTAKGHPGHPLYVPSSTTAIPFRPFSS